MTLLDLISKLQLTPVRDVNQEVRIVVMGEERTLTVGISDLVEITDWVDTPTGPQRQPVFAIVAKAKGAGK